MPVQSQKALHNLMQRPNNGHGGPRGNYRKTHPMMNPDVVRGVAQLAHGMIPDQFRTEAPQQPMQSKPKTIHDMPEDVRRNHADKMVVINGLNRNFVNRQLNIQDEPEAPVSPLTQQRKKPLSTQGNQSVSPLTQSFK